MANEMESIAWRAKYTDEFDRDTTEQILKLVADMHTLEIALADEYERGYDDGYEAGWEAGTT